MAVLVVVGTSICRRGGKNLGEGSARSSVVRRREDLSRQDSELHGIAADRGHKREYIEGEVLGQELSGLDRVQACCSKQEVPRGAQGGWCKHVGASGMGA